MTTRRSRAAQTPTESALVPITPEGDERRNALIRAVGFDQLSEAQRELALAIAQRYELDPMLKHLVMVDGRPYITRDGLLHVAHRSNDFDGIEVTDPVLDESPGVGGKRYWRARASVWRKSFSRPFIYPGRYPVDGKNARFAEEMAIKVAEVMTLRRAFDVSAPTIEERWDEDHAELPDAPAEPTSLAERVALKAAEIVEAPEIEPESAPAEGATGVERTQSVDEDEDEVVVTDEATEASAPAADVETPDEQPKGKPSYGLDKPKEIIPPQPRPTKAAAAKEQSVDEALESTGGFTAPSTGFGLSPLRPDEEPASPAAIEAFGMWATGRDPELIRGTARQMFPDVRQFADLTMSQLGALTKAIEQAERAVVVEPTTSEPVEAAALSQDERDAIASGAGLVDASSHVAERTQSADAPAGDARRDPLAKPTLCGEQSPWTEGATCTMDAGHKGTHRAGLKEAW